MRGVVGEQEGYVADGAPDLIPPQRPQAENAELAADVNLREQLPTETKIPRRQLAPTNTVSLTCPVFSM